ncbi:drug/metabolite transporter (DMT)-like permease [Aequitasia blattaphilus]|uniref:DMT family transporter n=1 Tax=Aequitasia blattaphilus TaxID=2949332 RepID=A0ABT1E9Y9_9FIRM|nr:DMT family transporter [Aequitasia blattaphilus]MCP1101792.1 DMT family transporter [Aequitasia blattaphilus]MCR8614432.1 DMT family transporter [Aequitasia blattaphilus]
MKVKNGMILALVSFIWGTSFVAQSMGMEYLEPFTFNGVRCLIGGVVLIPCIWLINRLTGNGSGVEKEKYKKKDLYIGGIACGVLLFLASSLQQIGIQYTTAGKSGFITAFYIVMVPVLGIFLKKAVGIKVWLGVALALCGLYFLCINEALTINKGDILTLVCALVFSLHIMVIDYFSPKVEGVKMSCIQFFVAGVLSLPFMFLFETPKLLNMGLSMGSLLYAGVLSCGVAYTLQIIGQKNMNPAIASLILSMEACFSVLAGWLVLKETLTIREGLGCIFMFGAILLAQFPERKVEKVEEREATDNG